MEHAVKLHSATTAHLADACLRLRIPVRCAPHTLRPATSETRFSGRACPVQHFGSVDVFLEALAAAQAGDVMVVGNDGRIDEACVGDLVASEVKHAGLAGIVIWGLHRDSSEISAIGLPVFSLGALPTGPQRLDARSTDTFNFADVGPHRVTRADFVVADDDGIIFLPLARLEEIMESASTIRANELRQSLRLKAGQSLRDQLGLCEYLLRRTVDPNYSFRQHLRETNAAVEE
jgi:4-hydroxy-4-methyl-2-oxoglutarate aldolase